MPNVFYKEPYKLLLPKDALTSVLQMIELIYDDEKGYQSMVQEAVKAGQTLHDIERNTDRLIAQLATVLPAETQKGMASEAS